MKFTDTKKSIILGIVFAVLLTSMNSGIYFGITGTKQTLLYPPFDWNFDTPLMLSEQISERSDYFYSFLTFVAEVTQPWSATELPYFNYSVGFITTWLNLETDEWEWRITAHDNPDGGIGDYTTNPEHFIPLSAAIAKDISTAPEIIDITENYDELLEEHFTTGKIMFEIMHTYQDGTNLRFRSFDNVVFIEYWRFTEYHSDNTGSGTRRDKRFEEQVFMAILPEMFPHYANAINQLLQIMFGTT